MLAVHPFSCPTVEVIGTWKGDDLWWKIGDKEISDKALRQWVGINLEYPWCYVGQCILQYHVNAWAFAQSQNA